MAEQRYQAVLAVIAEGSTVTEIAARFGVSRKTMHAWLRRYEEGGLEALADRSHRPVSVPHQMRYLVSHALITVAAPTRKFRTVAVGKLARTVFNPLDSP